MSIAVEAQNALRSFRSLICFDARRVFFIKDLKRHLLMMVNAGDRPPRYGRRKAAFHRRARACPSPCHDRGGQAPALRAAENPPFHRWALAGFHTRMRAGFPRQRSRNLTLALPPFEVCPRRGEFATWIDMQVVTGIGEVMSVSGSIPPL